MSDILLDDLARAMTDVDAPRDLPARVLAEIGRPQPHRWFWFALPAAVAASIVVAGVVALRPVLSQSDVPAVTRLTFAQHAATDPAPNIVAAGLTAAPVDRSAQTISADELAWLSRRLPALETPPLTLEPIQPVTPSIAPINVEPISLEPIAVPPPRAGSIDRH